MVKQVAIAATVAALTLFGTQAAVAAPIALALLDSLGNSSGVIIDGSAQDLDPADGVVSFDGAIGDWVVNTTSGNASAGLMNLSSVDASALTSSTLFILFTSLDNTPASRFHMTFATAVQNATAVYGAFGDGSNVGFGQAVGIGAIGPFTGGGTLDVFSGEAFGAGPINAPYSLTQLFVVSGNGAGVSIFAGEAALAAVPEPVTLFLLGSGVIAAAIRTRRGARWLR